MSVDYSGILNVPGVTKSYGKPSSSIDSMDLPYVIACYGKKKALVSSRDRNFELIANVGLTKIQVKI